MSTILMLAPSVVFGAAISITVSTTTPIQGDPLMISVSGTMPAAVQSISWGGKVLPVFSYQNRPTALYGIDLRASTGTTTVTARLADGSVLSRDIFIVPRKKVEAPLGIPEKLGGNTMAAATTLVNTLAQENASLLGLRTGTHAFWGEAFRYPIATPVVTDGYGYSRQTVGYEIAHKGTDFRAVEGTPVLAMNRGVVRLAREGRNYGKTIVVDHGLGVQTLYMHLSKINVNVGELVLPGQVIGLSGKTGYVEAAHLHVSVRINEVSIDPVAFLKMFGK